MSESVLRRVKRIVSGTVEDSVDALERGGGVTVMRESIREIDRAADDTRKAYDRAVTKRLQAVRLQRLATEKAAMLGEKARFAVAEKREDLAEAALSRQLDFEAEIERLKAEQEDARQAEQRLEAELKVFDDKKAALRDRLTAFEEARQEAHRGGDDGEGAQEASRLTDHAEAAFERAMSGVGGLAGLAAAEATDIAAVAEIDTLQRSSILAERLAALKAVPTD